MDGDGGIGVVVSGRCCGIIDDGDSGVVNICDSVAIGVGVSIVVVGGDCVYVIFVAIAGIGSRDVDVGVGVTGGVDDVVCCVSGVVCGRGVSEIVGVTVVVVGSDAYIAGGIVDNNVGGVDIGSVNDVVIVTD